tara:strand:+ start:723 stop:1085 length:363 start_codon:yes stop_codon:yes gene_type:complete
MVKKNINISKINSYYDNISWDKLENSNVSQTGEWNVPYKGKDWKELYNKIADEGFKKTELFIVKYDNNYFIMNGNHRIRILKEMYDNDYIVTGDTIRKDNHWLTVWKNKKSYYEELYNGN